MRAGQKLDTAGSSAKQGVGMAGVEVGQLPGLNVDLDDVRGGVHRGGGEHVGGMVEHLVQVGIDSKEVGDDGLELGHERDGLGPMAGDVTDHEVETIGAGDDDVVPVSTETDHRRSRFVSDGDVDAWCDWGRREHRALQLDDQFVFLVVSVRPCQCLADHLGNGLGDGVDGGAQRRLLVPHEHESGR